MESKAVEQTTVCHNYLDLVQHQYDVTQFFLFKFGICL